MDENEKRPLSDEEINQFLAQDAYSHFTLVVNKYWTQLVNYSSSWVGMANAEGLVQTALMNASIALRSYGKERILNLKLRSWLYTILTNECKRYLEKQVLSTTPIDSLVEMTCDRLTIPKDEQPEEELERAEIYDSILAAIERLSPRYRDVIFSRYIRDMKTIDIARELDKDLDTIKSQIQRGTALLRRL